MTNTDDATSLQAVEVEVPEAGEEAGDAGSSEEPAAAEPTGGRVRKREHESTSRDASPAKEPRLTAREAMQLRLLANVPALSGPLRDSRGRRRAFSLGIGDLIDGGLAGIVASSMIAPDDRGDAQAEAEDDGALPLHGDPPA